VDAGDPVLEILERQCELTAIADLHAALDQGNIGWEAGLKLPL
jgi:hypothetical protein